MWKPLTAEQAKKFGIGGLYGRNNVRLGTIDGQLPVVSRRAAIGQIEFQQRLQAIFDNADLS